MAAVVTADLTIHRTWYETTKNPRRVRKAIDVTIDVDGAGTLATNTIDAATLGFKSIEEVSNGVNAAGTLIVLATPSPDRSKILLSDLNVSTDADRAKPVAVTGIYRFTIKGDPA
jgi:hypothetical protein